MKYKTIIETDDYKNFEFFEDGNGKYIHGIDAGAVNNEWIALYFTECEQEIKTGHWILQPSNKEQGERDFIWWKCSECGQVIYSDTEKDRREYHAFCGRCGTKMVESQERDND
jgi:hypothetical protein